MRRILSRPETQPLECADCGATMTMGEFIENWCLRCRLPDIVDGAARDLRRRRIAERGADLHRSAKRMAR